MLSKLSSWILKLLGWTVTGDYPYHIDKKIVIGGPHTSNWDFFYFLMINWSMRLNLNFIGKASLFKPPLKWVMIPLGGIALEQSPGKSFVSKIVELFGQKEVLTIAVSPEGQRKKINKFKTGYYYIAKGAGIPVVPIVIDFSVKVLRIEPAFYLTDNEKEDQLFIESIYTNVEGYYRDESFGDSKT